MKDAPKTPATDTPLYFVNGMAIAGAKDLEDAKRIYEEAQNITGP